MSSPTEREYALELARQDRTAPVDFDFALDRRTFFQVAGAGIVVTVIAAEAFAQAPGRGASRRGSIGARMYVGEDGRITVMTSKVEVGQGSRTQLTQAAAEELRVSPGAIQLVMADTAVVPNDGGTFGSLTTPRTVPEVRKAAAAMHDLLVRTAASEWGVDPAAVRVSDGAAHHPKSKKTMTYAELVRSAKASESLGSHISDDVALVTADRWSVLGQPVLRPNARDIVTGAHQYASDIRRPNMLFGKVLRPPAYNAVRTGIKAPAKTPENTFVVIEDGFAGVAAPTAFAAQKTIDELAKSATWKTAPHPPSEGLADHLKKLREETESGPRPPRAREEGSVDDAIAAAAEVVRAEYFVPYIQHVPMEPRAAVAEWNGGDLTVWTGTQRPNGVRGELAKAFGISQNNVRVIVPDTGGGFGGKHTGECAIEAARLAKAAQRPVSLRWTREEEFTWAYYRPAGVIEVAAGLDASGSVRAWDFTNINSGGSAIETPYAIPNARTKIVQCDSPMREGSYRSLAATANTFARESFMDELAVQTRSEPFAFRMRHLDNPRMRAVLEKAAAAFGWEERVKDRRSGRGVGIACGTDKGSYTAACVEIEIDRRAQILVRGVTQAFECGAIQNPANLLSQVQGAIVMGLGGALREAIAFQNGKVLNASLKEYRVPRFEDVPPLDIHLIDRPDLPSAGAGETPIIVVAPAIANALFAATGNRVRELPLRVPVHV